MYNIYREIKISCYKDIEKVCNPHRFCNATFLSHCIYVIIYFYQIDLIFQR